MDTTQARIPSAHQFYTALAGDPIRLAIWRKLAAKLYAPDVKPLASGETPPASAAEASAEAGTFRGQPAETSG